MATTRGQMLPTHLSKRQMMDKLLADEMASAFISSKMNSDFETEMVRLESRLTEQIETLKASIMNDFKVLRDKWESASKREEDWKRKLSESEKENKSSKAQIDRLRQEIQSLKKTVEFQRQRLILSEKAVISQDAAERKKFLLSRYSPDDIKQVIKCQRLIRKGLRCARFRRIVNEFKKQAETSQNTPEDLKAQVHRMRTVREIFSTEKTYVCNLVLVVEHFLKPLREAVSNKLVNISPAEVQTIFSDIETISNFNNTLYGTLSQRKIYIHGTIGSIFLQLAPYLKMYTTYVNNYFGALTTLANCQRSSKSFSHWLKDRETHPSLNGLKLSDLLINPIQRVPRYVMLFQDLIKHTPPEHKDYANLEKLLTELQNVATLINERKRKAEQMEKVLLVQEKLSGDFASLVKPHRQYIREGTLIRNKNYQSMGEERLFFLFNDILLCTKQVGKALEVEDIRPLSSSHLNVVVPQNAFHYKFSLNTDGYEPAYFATTNEDDEKSWIADLEANIHQAREAFHEDEEIKKAATSSSRASLSGSDSGRSGTISRGTILGLGRFSRRESNAIPVLKYIKQGNVKVVRKGRSKVRWVVLHESDIYCYKSDQDPRVISKMSLKEIRVHKGMQKENEFTLEDGGQTLLFCCESKQESEAWQTAIKKTKLTYWNDVKGQNK